MPADRTMTITIDEMVAPVAWPRSLVFSSMPEANPRRSVGRVFVIVALFTMLKALVPKEVSSNSSSTSQKLTLVAKTANNTNPSAMDGIQKMRSNLGLYLSWVSPAITGNQVPKD